MFFRLTGVFKKHRSGAYRSMLFFIVSMASLAFVSDVFASEFPSLPYSLPYNYGGYDYTRVVQYKLSDGNYYAWYYKENGYNSFILHASNNAGSWPDTYLFPANADSARRFVFSNGSWNTGVTYDKLDDSVDLSESIRANFDIKADYVMGDSFDFGSRYNNLGLLTDNQIVQSATELNGTQFSDPNFVEIPEYNSSYQLTATFEYPQMLGPVFHADYKMTDVTTHVPVRIKSNVPLILSPDLVSHIQVGIVQKTDSSYATVKTVDPYLESYPLNQVLQYSLFEFSLPLLSGQSNYYTLFYVFDDEYLAQHPGYSIINSYNFSLTGLSPSDEDYEYGQSPILPSLDENGNSGTGTGSIVGDLIHTQLSSAWSEIQLQFADFFTLYDIASSAPVNAQNVALFSGTFSLNGNNAPIVFDPFHTLPIPPIVPNIISFVAYLGLGWFLIRNAHKLFD